MKGLFNMQGKAWKTVYYSVLGTILLLIFSSNTTGYSKRSLSEAERIISLMVDSIRTIKTLDFRINAFERVQGEYLSAESSVLLTVKPRIIYFRNEKRKISLYWKEGENSGQAQIKARALLGVPILLDPLGSMIRKNQHYSIFELGFDYFGKIFNHLLTKDKEFLHKNLNYHGKKTINGNNYHALTYENKHFAYLSYKTGKNESVYSIAHQLHISEYLIRVKNNFLSNFNTLKEGTFLMVPNDYCKKLILYLDEKTMLPHSITAYDETGLLENYEYTRLVKNSKLDKDYQQFFRD